MKEYLLRVEGINLSHVLDDTDDVSIRRGGGLMLRQAIRDVEKEFHMVPVSTGASIGIFHLKDGKDQALRLRGNITQWLNDTKPYSYATFAVDITVYEGNYRAANEALLAKIRTRQLVQSSLVFPEAVRGARAPCDFDRLRPAVPGTEAVKKRDHVSHSALVRFEYGRKQRGDFYEQELEGDYRSIQFTDDLHQLAEDDCFGNLSRKIALIYFDGNAFAEIQRKHCTTIDKQKAFDKTIKEYRRIFLRSLLDAANKDTDFKTSDGKVRLETLMWGGDEFLLIVPAWKGLAVAHNFFEISDSWTFDGEKLTHAGGLVFCGCKTPLARVRDLARQLADGIKTQVHDANAFDYLVLESIEYPTQPLPEYRAVRYGAADKKHRPLFPFHGSEVETRQVLELVPRRQLNNMALLLVRNGAPPPNDAKHPVKVHMARMTEVMGAGAMLKVEALLECMFPGQETHWRWLHLLDLWDYLLPQPAQPDTGGQ